MKIPWNESWVCTCITSMCWRTEPKQTNVSHSQYFWCLLYKQEYWNHTIFDFAIILQMPSESIQTPWLIPHFVVLQPDFKMDEINTSDPSTHSFRNVCHFCKWNRDVYVICVGIHTPSQYMLESPLTSITAVTLSGALNTWIVQYLPVIL